MNGILAAHLEVDPGVPRGAGDTDLLAGGDRTGESDAVDPAVAADPGTDLTGPGHQVHRAGGQVVEDVGERQGRERGELGRFADDVLPAASAGASFQHEQQQREVPGDDAADHAVRLLDHDRELAALRSAGSPGRSPTGRLRRSSRSRRRTIRLRRAIRTAAGRSRWSSAGRAPRSSPAARRRCRAAAEPGPRPASCAQTGASPPGRRHRQVELLRQKPKQPWPRSPR